MNVSRWLSVLNRLRAAGRRVFAGRPDACTRTTSYYHALRVFRDFLESRGCAGWEVATIGDIPCLSRPLLQEFAVSRGEFLERTALDLDTGAPAPLLWDFLVHENDIFPNHALWRFRDAAVFAFTMCDEDLWDREITFLAAPDAGALRGLCRELDAFRVQRARSSDEIQVIGKARIRVERGLGWEDVLLPEEQRRDIRSNVEGFFGNREIYARLGLPWKRGFLFVGPPGNGKTMLCRTAAAQAGVPCLYLLLSSRSEHGDPIGEMFARARRLAPCILVFEDLDSLFQAPGEMSYFLNLMDGFSQNNGLLVLATTNHPEEIDPALLNRPSRFDRVWRISDPALSERRACLGRFLASHLDGADLDAAAAETGGFSMTYLKEVYVSAALEALRGGARREDGSPWISGPQVFAAIGRLREQIDSAGRQFVERIPMGFAENA